MKFEWRKWIPRITWKSESEEVLELKETLAEVFISAEQLILINRGLNVSIGQFIAEIDNLRAEAVNLLSAITMQHGGKLQVGADFFEVLDDPDGPEVVLKVERQEDNSVTIILEEKQNGAEETNTTER
jgi:hypothetical protein